jgi:ubiquinone/menaquinone biosynthesis C-methylase UbiE
MEQHDLATRQFGSKATAYLTSSVHASGADLVRLTQLAARPDMLRALDLGCGAGHASFALARAAVRQVIAYDLAEPMLHVVAAEANARGHTQIETHLGPAEHLAFTDASFDLVVTRYSAHHWLDVRRAVREVARVLKPGGTFVVIDVLAPETPLMDTALQTLELLHDESHVRDYRESEWQIMLEAATFSHATAERWKLPIEFNSWVARIGTAPPRLAALKTVMDALPSEAREYFSLTADHSFAIDAGWLEVVKPHN